MKRFQTYILALIFAAAGFCSSAAAAVVYQDFEDLTTHSSKYFDLDGNGSFDLGVAWNYDDWADDTTAEASLPFGAPSNNGFAASGSLAEKLGEGDLIGDARSFRSSTVMLSRYRDDDTWDYLTWGNWNHMGEDDSAYLGFRFMGEDDALHYGWLRARVNPSNQYITLYDLAWENEAGKAILAGDKGSPVPVPAGVWLLGSGIATLFIKRRKK